MWPLTHFCWLPLSVFPSLSFIWLNKRPEMSSPWGKVIHRHWLICISPQRGNLIKRLSPVNLPSAARHSSCCSVFPCGYNMVLPHWICGCQERRKYDAFSLVKQSNQVVELFPLIIFHLAVGIYRNLNSTEQLSLANRNPMHEKHYIIGIVIFVQILSLGLVTNIIIPMRKTLFTFDLFSCCPLLRHRGKTKKSWLNISYFMSCHVILQCLLRLEYFLECIMPA